MAQLRDKRFDGAGDITLELMSAIISGLIGGAIAMAITAFVANRVGKSGAHGQLRFGPFLWVLGACCLAFALLPAAAMVVDYHRQFWPKLALIIGFGGGGAYCLVEAAFVRGSFDAEGIQFSSPWTGMKREAWKDLESLELNEWCSWYTLTFKSGRRIRLSKFLTGHMAALDAAVRSHEL